jgi:hypothetical protein
MNTLRLLGGLGAVVLLGCGQPAPESAPSGSSTAGPIAAVDLVDAAVTPLPAELQAGATVLGPDSAGARAVLRQGAGDMICLAPNPADTTFHAACYHRSLEAFMARGRALRAAGTTGAEVDSVRFREILAGTLDMPRTPAVLYQNFGGRYDPTTRKVVGTQPLYVVYIAGATTASTGLTEKPSETDPWIMFPGTPKAHIMFTGRMK